MSIYNVYKRETIYTYIYIYIYNDMYFEILCTEHVLYSNNEAPQRHESLAKHGDKEDGILYTSTFSNEKSYCRDVPC